MGSILMFGCFTSVLLTSIRLNVGSIKLDVGSSNLTAGCRLHQVQCRFKQANCGFHQVKCWFNAVKSDRSLVGQTGPSLTWRATSTIPARNMGRAPRGRLGPLGPFYGGAVETTQFWFQLWAFPFSPFCIFCRFLGPFWPLVPSAPFVRWGWA